MPSHTLYYTTAILDTKEPDHHASLRLTTRAGTLEIMDADRNGQSPYDYSPKAIEEIRKIKAVLDRDDSV